MDYEYRQICFVYDLHSFRKKIPRAIIYFSRELKLAFTIYQLIHLVSDAIHYIVPSRRQQLNFGVWECHNIAAGKEQPRHVADN